MNNQLPKNFSSFVWTFLKPYKFVAMFFVFIVIFTACWGPINNILVKHIINLLPAVEGGDASVLFWPATLVILNFIVFDLLIWRILELIDYRYKFVIKNNIIAALFDHILSSSLAFFQNNLSGQIANQITTLANGVEETLHSFSRDFIQGFALLIISLGMAWFVNPIFFYILSVWLVLFSFFSLRMSKRFVQLADEQAKTESTLAGQVVDSLNNQSNIRIFSGRLYEGLRMGRFFQATKQAFQKKQLYGIMLWSLQGLLLISMMAASLYTLICLYEQQKVTVGDFALMFGLSMELGYKVWYNMSRIDSFNQVVGKCKQSLEALIIPPDIQDAPDANDLVVTTGEIVFDNVTFHYKSGAILFQNLSFTIKAGQKVGLVGYSGGGKSTFVNLILRLYNVDEGRILIDGQNIQNVTQDSLRRNIAMIPQDPSLFHRSILENILYGKINASQDEVIDAAKKAHAHDFIIKLSEGYDSPAGERGTKVSGGQRQRIAMARAILKDAPIIIMDEATSQLDSVTELLIQNSLDQLMEGKTAIAIAHRLSTLLHMDRILVFDKGRIVEDGSHRELLAKNGLYKTLWNAQVGGFFPEKEGTE
jgi:ATP-binding cassette subfamily B protein